MSARIPCRSCDCQNISEFLDLGNQPLANNLLRPGDSFDDEPRFPLKVAVCPDCWLVQITETIPPVSLFEDYLYFSSFSDAMLKHSKQAVEKYISAYDFDHSSFAVEIASNDGYLLKNFVTAGIPCLGVEPAKNIAEVAIAAGVPTLCEFFGQTTASQVVAQYGQADIILGNNVFAHAPDINDFIGGMATLLKPDGRIALEFPYLGNFIDHIEFDTVYHEHVFYFSILALAPAFERHGLEIFDIERLPIHGGSLRLYAGHSGANPPTSRLKELINEEIESGMKRDAYYEEFAQRVRKLRETLRELVSKLKAEGKSIAAYGASAKGSTLLNYFDIGSETLDFVVDRSTYKQNRLTPGSHLPILPPEELLARAPDYTLLLTWNFADEILSQQQAYRDAGGKFIIPLPEPHIV
jgi:SAM-dependent methyltransferase